MRSVDILIQSKFFYASIIVGLWLYIAFKAYDMSMTHDESSSFFYLNDQNNLVDLFDKSKWSNANNHWLNTLLFQLSSRLFGPHELAIRLPNVLIFGVYAYYIYRLTGDIGNSYLRLSSFLFAIVNPYVLDFFSTARGYGLALAFCTGGMYMCAQYLVLQNIRKLLFGLLFFLVATLSLLSSVIFFPAVVISVFFLLYIINNGNFKKFVKPLILVSVTGIGVLFLTYIPITTLSQNAEFKWGSPSLIESFQSLVFHTSYGMPYAPKELFVTGFLAAIFFYCIYLVIIYLAQSKSIIEKRYLILSAFSFIAILGIMILLRHLTDTYYPIERKTIMYIPFLSILFFSSIDLKVNNKLKTGLGALVALFLIFHFLKTLNTTTVREWWYDQNTKEFAQRCVQDHAAHQPTIGCHWMFHPTLSFYNKTKYHNKILLHPYNKEIDTTQVYDYFICFDSDVALLTTKYDVLYKNLAGRCILKRKP